MPDFDDSSWANATEQGDSSLITIASAKEIWGSSVQAGTEIVLVRRTAAIPAGKISTCAFQWTGNDALDGIWVNGVFQGIKHSSSDDVDSGSIDPAILKAGEDNVLAFIVRNAD